MGDDATWLIMVERSLFTRPELTQQVVYIIVTLHRNGAYIKVEVTDRLKTVVTVALRALFKKDNGFPVLRVITEYG